MNSEIFSKFEFSNAIKVSTYIYVRQLKKKEKKRRESKDEQFWRWLFDEHTECQFVLGLTV